MLTFMLYPLFYSLLTFWILFTSSLWTLYFGLELQWILLTIFFIMGSTVSRGLFNYLIMNGILSITLIIGIVTSNSIILIIGCLGKIGFFPFLLVVGNLWYCSSYVFLMIDLINKWAYFGSFLVVYHLCILFNSFSYWFTLFNLLFILFFIKYNISIKHLLLISSLINYLFIILLILVDDYLFSFSYLSYYSISTILILIIISYFISWFNFNSSSDYSSSSLPSSSDHHNTNLSLPFLDFSQIDLRSGDGYVGWLSNVNITSPTNITKPFPITDLINLKFFILLSSISLIIFLLILFTLFPSIIFVNKFFSLNLLDNHSLSLIFNLVIFLLFIFQGFFLRSIALSLPCVNLLLSVLKRLGLRKEPYIPKSK